MKIQLSYLNVLLIFHLFCQTNEQTIQRTLVNSKALFYPVLNRITGYSFVYNSHVAGFQLSPSIFEIENASSSSLSFLFWSGTSNTPNFHVFSVKAKTDIFNDISSPWNYSHMPLGLMKGKHPGSVFNYASLAFSFNNISYFLVHGGVSSANLTYLENVYTMCIRMILPLI
jgi:hypothetical protein